MIHVKMHNVKIEQSKECLDELSEHLREVDSKVALMAEITGDLRDIFRELMSKYGYQITNVMIDRAKPTIEEFVASFNDKENKGDN